ncbi:uncharacterized protein K02A2.6-like [Hyposmocoma kahamanoa]|uniref:uncharacterized protein K02A2.6-like n=1 Tax=Hyposmocoma kahamanoa TaxID=1477025 RepID=UPI000E6D9ECA|nr:uncharacterized protein K02A2.6-like [Hyposmocoma kahamanoa]
MEQYANRLKKLASDCGYKDTMFQRQLRDRFATGLNHPQLEVDLKQKWPDLQETYDGKLVEVTFDQFFAVAQSRELAEGDADSSMPATANKVKARTSTGRHYKQCTFLRKLSPNQCRRCGAQERHRLNVCKAKDHTCDECHIQGHFESCCIKSGRAYLASTATEKKQPTNYSNKLHKIKHNAHNDGSSSQSFDTSSDESDDVFKVERKRNKDSKRIDVTVNGVSCTFDWDPGSVYSIISTNFWKRIGEPSLTKAPKLRAYGNLKLKPKGLTDVTVEIMGERKILPVVVMEDANPMLFGLQWSEMYKMTFPEPVYSVKPIQHTTTLKQVLSTFSSLFDNKLGKVKNYEVNIHIKPGAVPKHVPARPVKFSMRKNIEIELQRLVDEGIVTKVDPNVTPLEWATPTVNVVKTNGQIRICGDFRSTINPVIVTHSHPVPLFDQLRQNLANGAKFSKIDLRDAYLQFEIAPESKQYLTISTHKGYYQYNRMPFGISTAPSIFQHYLDELLDGVPNVAVYFDDIALTGKNDIEHLQTLSTVFSKLDKAGLKVNLKKCSFFQTEIEYLGHTITKDGIRPTKSKIDAIMKATPPTNAQELRSFLGLINFYEKFIPHLHSVCADLHALTGGRRKWQWTVKENTSFKNAKDLISKSKPLVAFDEKRPLYLACDASEKGVGAVLYHKSADKIQPIVFASRKLRPAETKYSVIDREALAIFFGIQKFDQYLRGTKFILSTDHKPLIHVLGPQRNLPKIVNNRLVRWALIIGGYDYDIVFTKGHLNFMADFLSRMPNPEDKPSNAELTVHRVVAQLQHERVSDIALTEDSVRGATRKDPLLKQVSEYIKTGWRENFYSDDLKPYARKRTELSIENKILMWQGRIVIPNTLRKATLEYLHTGHPGISAMRALARFYVWWPSIDDDIEEYIKRCRKCQENRPNNAELPIYSWSVPDNPWERLHIDFAGPFEGKYWFVLADAFSKWVEIKPMNQITTSKLCEELDSIFTTFGFPQFLVSDNGPQFTSQEFQDYCRDKGILHIKSSPYHPRTNGLAERLVRTFKSRLSSSASDHLTLKRRLENFLFSYRITPHSTTGKSPGQLMFGRQLHCILDNARPNSKKALQHRQIQANINSENLTPCFRSGDSVFVRARDGSRWEPATISRRTHRYSYTVDTANGVERRYHADQVRSRLADHISPVSTDGSQATHDPHHINTSEVEPLASSSGTQNSATTPMRPCAATTHSPPTTASLQQASKRHERTIRRPRRLIEEML